MKRAVLAFLAAAVAQAQPARYDLVVYGATASGVATAVSAARMGLKTALLEPTQHVGGMVSGGLSYTDVGKREAIGGLALEFYWRAGNHYNLRQYLQDFAWYVEPHVAEQIFREMLANAGVTLRQGRRLLQRDGVRKHGTRLDSIHMENGETYAAQIFADCSYEGDLMAQSGVTYTWGRESSAEYGESLAGVRGETPKHQFDVNIPAPALPRAAEPGSADRKVQAYNFRLIFSKDPANQVAFPKPDRYDPAAYDLLARLLQLSPRPLSALISIGPIPNRKADINNNGPVSTDYIGASWDYPNSSYARREEIRRAHEEYTKGFFYFLANDPRSPAAIKAELSHWGLAKDEFIDSGHFPPQLYIREARRMVGEYVMRQSDIQDDLVKPDAIGMGTYNSDSHNVQRVANEAGFIRNEGDMQVPVKPYQIPYRILLPRRSEAINLLVPVCVSATHVAYSTLRMEPQYMIMGQAAGVAAAMAAKAGANLQDIDTAALTRTLAAQGAIFEFLPNAQAALANRFRQLKQ